MEQTGLLERLRAQRESMHSGAPIVGVADVGAPIEASPAEESESARPMAAAAPTAPSPMLDEHAVRIGRLETNNEDLGKRIDSIEANLRAGLNELRLELPGAVTAEIGRHLTPTNEALAELGGRVGRMETDFTRERERWAGIVTSFDQQHQHGQDQHGHADAAAAEALS